MQIFRMNRLPKNNKNKTSKSKPAKAKKSPPTVTWQDVLSALDVVKSCADKAVLPDQLPVGQLPSKEVDEQCDRWFEHLFTTDGSDGLKVPHELASWMLARVLTAHTLVRGNIHFNVPGPDFTDDYDAALDLLLREWNEGLSKMWLCFHYDENRQLHCDFKRAGFSPN
jgi:hypothetical protein